MVFSFYAGALLSSHEEGHYPFVNSSINVLEMTKSVYGLGDDNLYYTDIFVYCHKMVDVECRYLHQTIAYVLWEI